MSAVCLVALVSVTAPQRASAAGDDDPPDRVARLNYLRGPVSFQPAGEVDWVSAAVNQPATTGDRLWTDDSGRAEMHTGSATIRMGARTGMSFLNLDDRTTQVELWEGTLNIRVVRLDPDEVFEVDAPNQAFSILRPGQYRIEASEDGASTMVTVRAGEGEVTGDGQIYRLEAGLTGTFSGTRPLRASIVRSGGDDEFDSWSQSRDRRDDASASARYVSPYVVGYQDLDDYGSWRTDATYGNVWTPRVAAGWAPYRDGHWAWVSPWGWTWVDDAPWGYAPFHYGRWVHTGSAWGWIPGPVAVRAVYAPALVVFFGGAKFGVSLSAGAGNVGWFPLGPGEVYVPAYPSSRAYVERVNVSETRVSGAAIAQVSGNGTGANLRFANRDVRGGVTVVSRGTFTGAQPVGRAVVSVSQQEIASGPISRRAQVAPTRDSVFGRTVQAGTRVAQPPAAAASRVVVARTAPPAAPVPFSRQQQRLAAQPGQPLARGDVESLRSTSATTESPRVRLAPPGRVVTPASGQRGVRPADAPVVEKPARGNGNAHQAAPNAPETRSDRPARANRPQPAGAPAEKPARADASPNEPATPARSNAHPPQGPGDKKAETSAKDKKAPGKKVPGKKVPAKKDAKDQGDDKK